MADTLSNNNRSTHKYRYWRQVSEKKSFWPVGWLLLLLWLLLFIYGLFVVAPEMEAHTKVSVTNVLSSANYRDFSISVDGQEVLVEGKGGARDKLLLHALASRAGCEAWGNTLTCPTNVKIVLAVPEAEPIAVKGEPTPVAKMHEFSFHKQAKALLLGGEVASAGIAEQIVAQAESSFPVVTSHLIVTDQASQQDDLWAAKHALTVMQTLQEGTATWQQGKLSVTGRVYEQDEQALRDTFNNAQFFQLLGALELETIAEADRCNQQFKQLLATSGIRFKTARAQISSQSEKVLQQVAALAKNCPMKLIVEGHTDNTGNENLNINLSYARAQSVIEALQGMGVDVSHLTPYGYGSKVPVAGNDTVDGRAKNRRIEIKVADPKVETL